MRQSENEMIGRIFAATDQLMASAGLPNLSMHKIAKQAGISAGTIYLYFKNKEELLRQFADKVFLDFQQVLRQEGDEQRDLFTRYRQMWWNVWHYLQNNPTKMANMHQYQSLPGFLENVQEWERSSYWKDFCTQGIQAGVIADLPFAVLFALSLESVITLSFKGNFCVTDLTTDLLEAVIQRSWQAICN